MTAKGLARRVARRLGFDIVRFQREQVGVDPFIDMQRFLAGEREPTIFDVGANIGQSVAAFKDAFPRSTIHSFEPSPATYEKLKANCTRWRGVTVWNLGVGSSNSIMRFRENEHAVMSSFLPPGDASWGKVVRETDVEVVDLDSFARGQCVDFIDILKSDTQGFDFEVLKGAGHLMDENRIAMVYIELIFSDMYEELPPFHEVYQYLWKKKFRLVTFYRSHFQGGLIGWTDALFVNRQFIEGGMRAGGHL